MLPHFHCHFLNGTIQRCPVSTRNKRAGWHPTSQTSVFGFPSTRKSLTGSDSHCVWSGQIVLIHHFLFYAGPPLVVTFVNVDTTCPFRSLEILSWNWLWTPDGLDRHSPCNFGSNFWMFQNTTTQFPCREYALLVGDITNTKLHLEFISSWSHSL